MRARVVLGLGLGFKARVTNVTDVTFGARHNPGHGTKQTKCHNLLSFLMSAVKAETGLTHILLK